MVFAALATLAAAAFAATAAALLGQRHEAAVGICAALRPERRGCRNTERRCCEHGGCERELAKHVGVPRLRNPARPNQIAQPLQPNTQALTETPKKSAGALGEAGGHVAPASTRNAQCQWHRVCQWPWQ